MVSLVLSLPQTLLRSYLPTNSLLARSYNNVLEWLKLPGLSARKKLLYPGTFILDSATTVMWLLSTQNSIRIGVKFTRGLDNVCWDYVAIVKADLQPIEICVQWGCWWRDLSNKNKPILPLLTDCLSGGRTAIKSGRDNPWWSFVSREYSMRSKWPYHLPGHTSKVVMWSKWPYQQSCVLSPIANIDSYIDHL